jgi:hypothetical protein
LVAYCAGISDVLDQVSQFLADDILDLLVVVTFGVVAVFDLVSVEVVDFVVLLATENEVGRFDLHVVQNLVDVHVGTLVIRTGLDQGLGKILTGFVVRTVSNIAFPQQEHLAN